MLSASDLDRVLPESCTHVAFTDESNWNIGRYRSIAVASVRRETLPAVLAALSDALVSHSASEFKWSAMAGDRDRVLAENLCAVVVEFARRRDLRLDVVVWDTHDCRHNVPGRKDLPNLERMYYHVLHDVLGKRWPVGSRWWLLPDEHNQIRWEQLQDYLDTSGVTTVVQQKPSGGFRLHVEDVYVVEGLSQCSSRHVPIIQIADLFAGMAAFSRTHFDRVWAWRQSSSPQLRLPFEELNDNDDSVPSRSDSVRLPLVSRFYDLCGHHRLGVSLQTRRGLWTPLPTNPINFWHYMPQGDYDKAPTSP